MANNLHSKLAGMINAYWISQAVYVAAELGIADLLAQGPRSVEDLAEQTSTHSESLYRVLRALASVELFTEHAGRQFELNPMAEFLRSEGDLSLRPMARMMGDEHYRVCGQLLEAVRSGELAFDKVFGQPIFDYLSQSPDKAAIFDAAMFAINGRKTKAILDAYDLSGIEVLADVGGGNGSNLIAMLQRHPSLRGILFDLPHVMERARANVESAGVADRCQLVAGNFFDAVPPGADAYMMRHIIHDWDDAKALAILKNCHSAMRAGSKLLLIEAVILPGSERASTKLLDLTMMLLPGGKERSEDQYRKLYAAAGFDLTRIVFSELEVDVIEGVRR